LKYFHYFGNVNTEALLTEAVASTYWGKDNFLRSYPQGPFGETDSLIVRFPPRTVHDTEHLLAEHRSHVDIWDCQWLPVAEELPLIKNLVLDIGRMVEATRLGRVFVNLVKPGGRIYRHADTPEHANTWCRLHVVLHAEPGVKFYCGPVGDEELCLFTSGDFFYFSNEYPHEVINESEYDRIHLVMDFRIEHIKP
jgi:hypothetical protein